MSNFGEPSSTAAVFEAFDGSTKIDSDTRTAREGTKHFSPIAFPAVPTG